MINHPPHYTTGEIQPIDFIDDTLDSNPNISSKEAPSVYNIIKLCRRMGLKGDKLEDLEKIQFFANKLVRQEKQRRENNEKTSK